MLHIVLTAPSRLSYVHLADALVIYILHNFYFVIISTFGE